METKYVTYKNLHKGQKICGTRDENCTSSFTAFVKESNVAYVTVEKWNPGGDIEKIPSTAMFEVELTEAEYKAKYREKAKEVLKSLENKLYVDEIGPHSMWNAWLDNSPYDIAANCRKEKIRIIGVCTDIVPKTTFFGTVLDIGVCAEHEDGERFWCHFDSDTIASMKKRYKELLDKDHKESNKPKIFNKCPKCRSRLQYSRRMSYSWDSLIKLNGEVSHREKKSNEDSMECDFISCTNEKCDFVTDCNFKCWDGSKIKIWQDDGKFYYEKEE